MIYSKTCLKRPLKNNIKTKVLKTNGSLLKVESIAFCDTFDLHLVIISLKEHNQPKKKNNFLSSF